MATKGMYLVNKAAYRGLIGKYKKNPYKKRFATVDKVKRLIRANVENKLNIVYPATTFVGIANAWTELDISTVTSGYGLVGRVGRELKITSLQMKMVFDIGDTTNIIRMVLGLYVGTATTPLATATATIDSALRPIACRNFMQRKLYDNYITLDAVTNNIQSIDYFKKFKKPITIKYGDDTANYPSARLILSMISDSGAAAHPCVSNGYIVVSFEDA